MMNGVCAIVFDKDRSYASFARAAGKRLFFIKEEIIPFAANSEDIAVVLREASSAIEKTIQEVEKYHKFRVDKIFLQLPAAAARSKKVSDIIPLKRRKKINASDIIFAKQYLEDKFLDWNDCCVHNLVLSYEAAQNIFTKAPLGIWSHRLGLTSLLIWVKENIYREIEDIFDSLDRCFAGFIAPEIGIFSSAFSQRRGRQAVISIEYEAARCVALSDGGLVFNEYAGFGLRDMIGELAKQFLLEDPLARELFERYISFKEIPYHQEVTLKKGQAYINLSTQSLNLFIKRYVKDKMGLIIDDIKRIFNDEMLNLSVIGRLGAKEGVFSFYKECLPYSLSMPLQNPALSSSYGCLFYGVKRFMENEFEKNEFFLQKVIKTYREYF
jgi:cell division ATPase FtsA